MSSIDKYVASEAKKYDPAVKVTNVGGRIIGRLNGQVVFNIADRYGYLNASEAAKIRQGIEQYKRDIEEMARRVEEERLAARARAESALKRKRREASEAVAAIAAREKTPTLTFNPTSFTGFNADKLKARVAEVNAEYASAVKRAKNEAAATASEIESIGAEIAPTLSAEEYRRIERRLGNISIERGDFSKASVKKAEVSAEIATLSEAVRRVRDALNGINVKAIPAELRGIIEAMISEVRGYELSSVDDVDKMLAHIDNAVTIVNGRIEESKDAALMAEARELEGALIACREIKSFVEENSYDSVSFEVEIEENSKILLNIIQDLKSAPYTTASEGYLAEAERIADEALRCKDEATLKNVNRCIEQLKTVKEKDRVLEADYDDYEARTSELRSRGVDVSDEVFDARAYDSGDRSQTSRLIKKQIDAGIREASNNAAIHMSIADESMEELGYVLVKADASDPCAPEAYYAKEGMPGVLCKVSAEAAVVENEDGEVHLVWGVRRTLVGVTDGVDATDVETVKRAAAAMELSGEVSEFINRVAEKSGGDVIIGDDYVDAESEGSELAIEANGALMLEGTVTVEGADGAAVEMSLKDRIDSVVGEKTFEHSEAVDTKETAKTSSVGASYKKLAQNPGIKVIKAGEDKEAGKRARAAVQKKYQKKRV